MNDRHLEEAFAPMPRVVLDHIDEALKEVQAMNQKHRKPTMALVFAILLALAMAGGAVAAGMNWNALDFLSRGHDSGAALPEARDLVQTEIPQTGGLLEEAVFTVEEAMCDGYDAYVVFSVKPAHEDTLLVTSQSFSSAPASRFIPELPDDVSLAQWAEENGYARVEAIRLTHDDQSQGDGFDWEESSIRRQEDGTYRIMLKGKYQSPDAQDVTFRCHTVTRWRKDAGESIRAAAELTATLDPAPEPLWVREWEGEAEIPGTGVTIEKIVLTGTPIAMHTEITHKGEGSRFITQIHLLDDEGNPLKGGAGNGIGRETKGPQYFSYGDRYEIDFSFDPSTRTVFSRILDYYRYEATAEPPTHLNVMIEFPPSWYTTKFKPSWFFKQYWPVAIRLE